MSTPSSGLKSGDEPRTHGTILDIIRDYHLRVHPDYCVLTWVDGKGRETERMTYDSLWRKAGALSNMLETKLKLKPGDRVMVAYPFGLEFLVGLIACMRAGIIACSVYPPNPTKFATDLPIFYKKVEDAGAKFILTDTMFKRVMMAEKIINFMSTTQNAYSNIPWINTDKIAWNNVKRSVDHPLQLEDIAFVQYTSGSTGFPKGVMISHRCLMGNCAQINRVCTGANSPEESFGVPSVGWVPQYHDLGLIGGAFTSLYGGWKSVGMSPLDFIQQPFRWHDIVIKYKAKLTTGPNFAFGLMVKRVREKEAGKNYVHKPWRTIETIIMGAEPADPQVIQDMTDVLGIPKKAIVNAYGMAETGVFISGGPPVVSEGAVACGPMDAFSKIRLVQHKQKTEDEEDDQDNDDDQDGSPTIITEDGVVGEIWVQNPIFASGYWQRPELSKSTFNNKLRGEEGEWLATGDLGRMQDGYFYVTGRKKELIIINGRNYFPVDIERVVEKRFPNMVRPGCTVAYQHSLTEVGLVLELRKGVTNEQAPSIPDIRQAVSTENNVGIQHVLILKDHTVPKTTSGKLRRKETQKMCLQDLWPQDKILTHWNHASKPDKARTKIVRNYDTLSDDSERESDDSNHKDSEGVTRDHQMILRVLEDQVGGRVQYSNLVSELGLTSVEMTGLKSILEQELGVEDDAIEVSWFFDGDQTVRDLIDKVLEIAQEHRMSGQASAIRQPYVPPLFVYLVSFFLQGLSALVPPLYLGASSLPGFFLFKYFLLNWNLTVALLLSPLFMCSVMVQSGVLLVLLKWLLVGKQVPYKYGGYHAVWSFPFAGRWIVRQCCRLSWKYTPWGQLSGTELLNILYRCLGAKIGKDVSIGVGGIDDFDLVTIGDGCSIWGVLNTEEVSLGVQVFQTIEIGNNCSVGGGAVIGRGSRLEDNVHIVARALVPPNSQLGEGKWHGKPVEQLPDDDEATNDAENPTKTAPVEGDPLLSASKPKTPEISKTPFTWTQYFTVVVLSPYLFTVEFGLLFLIWHTILTYLGWGWLAPLVWVAPTASWFFMLFMSILLKNLLLGKVRARSWQLYGSFHCCKFVVDHVVLEHMYRWHTYSQLFGCPFADSMLVRRTIYRLLGAKIGGHVMFFDTPTGLISYDLLTVNDGTMWGGGSAVEAFRYTDKHIIGEEVTVGRNVYVGGCSLLTPGTKVYEGAAIATFTVASGSVRSGELVIGTQKRSGAVDLPSAGISSRHLLHFEIGCVLGSFMLCSGSALIVAVLYRVSKFLSDRIWFSALRYASALVQSCMWSIMISLVVGLGLPLLSTILIIVSKTMLVGAYRAGSTPHSDSKLIPHVAFTWTILRFARELGREMSSGTWMEVWYNRALGATIGNHVYLDGAYLFEHDLIEIGDYSTVRESGLSSHQVSLEAVEYAPIRLGQRCTMNFASLLHGRDSLEDDTTLDIFSQPIIGSKLAGGRWLGYPAAKVSSTNPVPPRPQDPMWYIIALHPLSAFGMAIWGLIVLLDHYVLGFGRHSSRAFFRERRSSRASYQNDMPPSFRGVWVPKTYTSSFEDTRKAFSLRFSLETGEWSSVLRCLRLNAGTYMQQEGKGSFWWDWVTYDWQFDASRKQAVGVVRMGGLPLPAPIVKAHLMHKTKDGEDEWLLGHSWFRREFNAASSSTMSFVRMDNEPRLVLV